MGIDAHKLCFMANKVIEENPDFIDRIMWDFDLDLEGALIYLMRLGVHYEARTMELMEGYAHEH